jgi:hypothetical protein
MSNGTRYDFFELLKEAHDHGRNMRDSWSDEKSFYEFLMQYNLVKEYNLYHNKKLHPVLAKGLREKNYSIRQIARMLGYKHPGSISHLLEKA